MASAARQSTNGQEILVVDGDERILRGLERLFRDLGMLVTAVTDVSRARDQLANKFFPVALVDLDTPQENAGLDLIPFAKQAAPLTEILLMTGRGTFEAAAAGFRAGAADVVPKTQDAVPYLRERVARACAEVKTRGSRDRLLAQLPQIHDGFLQRMMDLSRRVVDLEDRLSSREAGSSPSFAGITGINLLLVDDSGALAPALERLLPSERGWRIRVAQNGGEALDAATQRPPQVLVLKERLPDLPSTMIVKTVKAQNPDMVALLFTPPQGDRVGEVKMVESSKELMLVPSFTDPGQLASSLEEVREAIKQKAKERRYLKVFRRENLEFLNRYNRVKAALDDSAPKKPE